MTWTEHTGGSEWRNRDLTRNPSTGEWTGHVDGGGPVDFIVQAVDSAGNVGMSTSKGTLNPARVSVEAGADQTTYEGRTVYFKGSITGPVQAQSIDWDFGDGSTASGTLSPRHAYANDGDLFGGTEHH